MSRNEHILQVPNQPIRKPRPWDRETTEEKKPWARVDNSFYHTTVWRKARLQVLDDEPICVFCQTDTHIEASTVVDHVIPIAFGGAKLDRRNLQGICASCHNTKSSIEGKFDDVIQLKHHILSKGVGVKNFWRFL